MVIQQYQDPRVGKYLQYGYWYQEHRGQLERLVRAALVVLVVVIWTILGYFAYNFILAQADYEKTLTNLTKELVNISELQKTRAPQEPQVSAVAVVAGENQTRADFIAFAENTNPNWSVELDYNFVWPDGQTTTESAIILPQAKTVLASRGVTVNILPVEANLQIIGKRWRRLRGRVETERLSAAKSGIVIDSPLAQRDDGVTSATYTIKNQSIYNWLTPRFVVVLSQAGAPVAAGVNEVAELISGSEQSFLYRWRQILPAGLSVEIYPLLNPFDESSYRLPSGGNYAL